MRSSSPSRPRGLRVGVVLGDTLIAEQVLERGSFSIGRKAACTVPLPLPGLPARWELLALDARGPHLRLGPGMDLRLGDGDTVRTRAEVDGAVGEGPRVVAIPRGARGKVVIGEVKVMFQELELAPRAPAPRLPPELRSTLAERVDGRLAAFAAASLALHVGLMAAARLHDPPAERTTAQQVLDDYVAETSVIDAADLAFLDRPPTRTEPAAATPAPPTPATPSSPGRPTTARPARPTGPAQPVDAAGDATRVADALFSDDDGPGSLTGDAARRRPGGDLAGQLDELRAAQARVSLGDGSDRELPRSDGPRLGTTEPTTTPDLPGQVDHATPPKHEPDHVRVTLTPPRTPPGEPSVDGIIGKIKSVYMPGLVRCYKKAMADGGALSGKVVLAFEVGERGSVSAPSATGVDPGLEACVEGLMGQWRFNPVVDDDGEATEVDVKVTLQLRPD